MGQTCVYTRHACHVAPNHIQPPEPDRVGCACACLCPCLPCHVACPGLLEEWSGGFLKHCRPLLAMPNPFQANPIYRSYLHGLWYDVSGCTDQHLSWDVLEGCADSPPAPACPCKLAWAAAAPSRLLCECTTVHAALGWRQQARVHGRVEQSTTVCRPSLCRLQIPSDGDLTKAKAVSDPVGQPCEGHRRHASIQAGPAVQR